MVLKASSDFLHGDATKGAKLFKQHCSRCHKVEKGAGSDINGPNLNGLFGRKAGKSPGFIFSDANKNKGIIWNRETLSVYLQNPAKYIPGTTMVFSGLKTVEERTDLIAYLEQATK